LVRWMEWPSYISNLSNALSTDDLAAGVMLPSVVGTPAATSCHRRGAGGPI
jgi:hypothetical protein